MFLLYLDFFIYRLIETQIKSYKFIMYTTLVGFGSVGKSPAMEIVEEASYLIEKANGIDNENSQICSAGTVEGLVELLRKQGIFTK